MDVKAELHDLQQKALLFATLEDRETRWNGGRWVERQCNDLDNRFNILRGFNEELKVELGAIITIVFDYCLYDCLEDEDWLQAMPTRFDGDINDVMRTLKHEGQVVRKVRDEGQVASR